MDWTQYRCFQGSPVDRSRPFFILGPCVIENEALLDDVARELVRIRESLRVPIIFKASYDKANRSSANSYRGPGAANGLRLLAGIRERYGLPVLTDVHESNQVAEAARWVDVLQIPAFLCRQTDLLMAAGDSGLPVNIKKGQFMAPQAMGHAVDKVRRGGNNQVFLTERGTTFGYGDLVVDFRGFPVMRSMAPLILDATHSVQRPPVAGSTTGGNRNEVRLLARAAAAVGVDGYFMETHPDPDAALSDGPNMVPLDKIGETIEEILRITAARSS
jgi:2-dehydro-3-deoxyphosphooctonate aldolase (KDO 8-P synthase)